MWIGWIFWELFKDAVFGSINQWIGRQSGSFWVKFEPLIEWAGRQDYGGLSAWIFLAFIGVLLFLSWRDTRPPKGSIGLSGSLEVKEIPGPVLPEKNKPNDVKRIEDWVLANLPAFNAASEILPFPPPFPGQILMEKQELNDGSLVILLTNQKNEVKKQITVNVIKMLKWSNNLQCFHIVPQFDGDHSPLPIKLKGPAELYPDDPKGFRFWSINPSKNDLVLRDLEKPGNSFWGLGSPGIWQAILQITTDKAEYQERVYFQWERGEIPKFKDCPKPKSVIDPELNKTQDFSNLWDLRRKGISLRNERISHEEYGEWKNKFESWRDEVLSEAQKISSGLRSHLEVLDQLRQPDLGDPVNSDHERDLRILSEILARLQAYLGERL